jgi:hypothetical protein
MYVNAKMITIEPVSGMGKWGRKGAVDSEFKYDIFDTL